MSAPRGSHSDCGELPVGSRRLAAALAHHLRTPLAALSGEVELALVRERSPAEYRAALSRIGERISELVAMTGDLAVLGEPAESRASLAEPVPLRVVMAALAVRRGSAARVVVPDVAEDVMVVGEPARLARAMTLLAEHAVAQCGPGTGIAVRVSIGVGPAGSGDNHVALSLEAEPRGFLPRAWLHLAQSVDADDVHAPGEFALRTAACIIQDYGGSLELAPAETGERVVVRLQRA
ncbi:MAG TPA: histidine kinase dimerization/phospho-acceptor domain-containing protein [Vicinamibacterales bacterium]|nr:histidine kinase dimerization/phospho-acceptor domain-containing protein [Vicinamibacterales bacterium]